MQLDIAKSDIEAKVAAAAAVKVVKVRKVSLRKLESLNKIAEAKLKRADKALSAADQVKMQAEEGQRKAADKVKEQTVQLNTAKSTMEAKIAAGAVEKDAVEAVKTREASLRKLEGHKKIADAKLRHADKVLSAADQAKVRAEEVQQKAADKVKEQTAQIDIAKSDLKSKLAAATAAKDAVKAAKIIKVSLPKLEKLKKIAEAKLRRADKVLSAADKAKVRAVEGQRKTADKVKERTVQRDAAQSDLEAKATSAAAVKAVKARKASLRKLESRKEVAEAKLSRADKALSTADQAKVLAVEGQRKAADKAKEQMAQLNTAKSDLKAKLTVAAVANDAVEAARIMEVSLRKLEKRKEIAEANLRLANKALSAADQAKVLANEEQRKAADKAKEQAAQLDIAKSDLKAKITAAAAVKAVKVRKVSLIKLESLKEIAGTNLRRADKALSAADQAKVVAEEGQRTATDKAKEQVAQFDIAKSDLKAKLAAIAAVKVPKIKKASLLKLESLKGRADAELRHADKVLIAADQVKMQAEEGRRMAADKTKEQVMQLRTAKSDVKVKFAAAAAAKDAIKTAKIKKSLTTRAAFEAKLTLEPVSVYISRRTQKLYVRRNTHKPAPDGGGEVFDASIEVPITIRDPDKPTGTHVFTAMEHNDVGLLWTAVTINNLEDASGALDRITIPQDVLNRIAPTALPRSSIIISDEPLSEETNYRTEFVTVLRNQPHGGFITRKPTRNSVRNSIAENRNEPTQLQPNGIFEIDL